MLLPLTLAACLSAGPYADRYSPLHRLLSEWEAYGEGEDFTFTGTVVDARTGQPIKNAEVRLELLRMVGGIKYQVYETLGLSDPNGVDPEILQECDAVDRIGSTEAYDAVNFEFDVEDAEAFMFERDVARTDSLGRFVLESTRRIYESPSFMDGHASLQRVVVEAEGYGLFSQGVLSACEGHLEALKPVALRPARGNTLGG